MDNLVPQYPLFAYAELYLDSVPYSSHVVENEIYRLIPSNPYLICLDLDNLSMCDYKISRIHKISD